MAFDTGLLGPDSGARAQACALRIREYGVGPAPRLALVLGTGLGGLADAIENGVAIAFSDLPGFPSHGVSGHAGRLLAGTLAGVPVVILQGRAHYYEGGDAQVMRVPLETLALLGVERLLLTNSAGGLHDHYRLPALVSISDHINWSGRNPLIGDSGDARFVNLVDAYDPALRGELHAAAEEEGITLSEGVYAWFSGPSFETPAEIRMARMLGADLVGMSTVPEVIMARRLGLRVAAVSMVTNFGAGMKPGEAISHDQTKAMAHAGAADMQRLILRFVSGMRQKEV